MSYRELEFEATVYRGGRKMMLHFPARNNEQAKAQAKKHGHLVHIRKADISRFFTDIEKLELNQSPLGDYLGDGVYDSDISLDTLLGLRRAERINNNLLRDKKRL